MLALIGFAMIGAIIFFLPQEKLQAAVVVVPVIAALARRRTTWPTSPNTVKVEVEKISSVAVLFIFSIT